jgi:hypothetical protein
MLGQHNAVPAGTGFQRSLPAISLQHRQRCASSAGVALQMMLAEARTAALPNMAYQSCITVSAALYHQHT